MKAVAKRKKIPVPAENSNPVVQPIAQSLYRLSYLDTVFQNEYQAY